MSATMPSATWERPKTECRWPCGANRATAAPAQRIVAATSSADAGTQHAPPGPVHEVPEVVGGGGPRLLVEAQLTLDRA